MNRSLILFFTFIVPVTNLAHVNGLHERPNILTTPEPRNPSIHVSELYKIRQSRDLKALESGKIRSFGVLFVFLAIFLPFFLLGIK